MRSIVRSLLLILLLSNCQNQRPQTADPPYLGTWQLIGATRTEADSTYSTFAPTIKFIKIISPTHFSFMGHDLKKGQDSTAFYVSGGGRHRSEDGFYKETLEYCSARQWEGHEFAFKMTLMGDTLVQNGIERIEELGVDHIITETYIRLKN